MHLHRRRLQQILSTPLGPLRCLLVGTLCLLPLSGCRSPGEDSASPSLASASPPSASSPTAPPPARLLAPSRRLQGELESGETHAYTIPLAAQETLDLVVDQQGVDVVLTLLDLQGGLLLHVDNPSGADGSEGPEEVFWVSETAASYRLTVSALGDQAGRYEILLRETRPATPTDRRRAAAEIAMSQADLLYDRSVGEARKTIDQYQAALAVFQALGVRSREADALYRLGRSWRVAGDRDQAIASWELALAQYSALDNRRQEAVTLHNLCTTCNASGQLGKAHDLCQRASTLWQQVGDRRGRALSANESGMIAKRLGEGHRALTFYDQALESWRSLGEPSEEARTLHNRGRLYALLGKPKQALLDLSAALAIRRNLGQHPLIATTLNGLAYVHASRGDMEKAQGLLQEALALQGPEKNYRRAITLSGIAWVHWRSGEMGQALDEYRQAQEIFHAEGRATWEAQSLMGIGWILAARGQAEEALDSFRRALPLLEAVRQRSGQAESLWGIATAERQLGHLKTARASIEEALLVIEDLRTRSAVASSDLRAYYFATKQHYYDFDIDLLMQLHEEHPGAGYDREALAANERARARSLLEMLNEGGQDLERGAEPALVERARNLERQINAKELQLVWLLENSADERQLQRVEHEQQSLLREVEWVRGQIRLSSPEYASLTQPTPLRVEELQGQLAGDGASPGTLLLYYKLGEERSFLWAVTADTVSSFLLPPRAHIEEVARRAYELISQDKRQARQRVERDLAELSDLLLRPAGALLQDSNRLLLITDGALRVLPWSALPIPTLSDQPSVPGLPLVTSLEIIRLPSASALAALRLRTSGRPPAPKTLAVLADPVFGTQDPRLMAARNRPGRNQSQAAPNPSGKRTDDLKSLPRLIYSGQEAETILALVPAEHRFQALGFAASRDAVQSGELNNYRILHFATHGHLNEEFPELSRLVLSQIDEQGNARDDGLLHAYEIYRLKFSAELVVLSACQTALGPQIPGEGLVGLTRAFLHAGAARVVVSLWEVNDRATAELMGHFYRHLLVDYMPPAAALRAAQNLIRQEKRWRAPYYWAGFTLEGESKDIRR